MTAAREPVAVDVALDPALHERIEAADPGLRGCRELLMAGISRLADELGLPAEPDVAVRAGPSGAGPVAVAVAGTASRSARRIAGRPLYWASAAGLPLGTLADLGAALMATDGEAAGRVLAASVTEMISSDAELLLTPGVVTLWAAQAHLPAGWEPEPVLRELLRLRLPPGTGAEVAAALKGSPAGSTAGVEEAIAARSAGPWEMRVSPDSLREVTADAMRTPNRFRAAGDSFFDSTGVRMPLVTLGQDAALPPGSVSFTVFGVTGPLMLGLDDAAVAAPDGKSRAPAGPGALMTSALGMLAADRIGALVTTSTIPEVLSALRASYPRLCALSVEMGLERVTRLLRALVTEGVSIRNLPPVLQAALDVTERYGPGLGEAELLHQTRVRIGQMIALSAAGAADRLEAARVPAALEDLGTRDAAGRLLAFAGHAVTSDRRALVASPQARAAVRGVIAGDYPQLAVLGADELAGVPLAEAELDSEGA